MTREEFNTIKQQLGFSPLGFFDWDNDPGQWRAVIADHFSRAGQVNGEVYSSGVNRTLSTAAMLQTPAEVLSRLEALVEDQPTLPQDTAADGSS